MCKRNPANPTSLVRYALPYVGTSQIYTKKFLGDQGMTILDQGNSSDVASN